MKEIIYNDNNLKDEDIHEWVKRAKVLVVNSKDEILIGHTIDNYYFLGGHVDGDESDYECLVREIKEEAGIDYDPVIDEPLISIKYLLKDYPEVGVNKGYISNYYVIYDDMEFNIDNVDLTDGEKDIILGASNGKGIRFSESDIRPMGRISAGVRGILVEGNEKVVGMAIVNTDGDEIVIVTDKGYGKRTNVDAFRVQVRGGKGVKALNLTAKNGTMVSLLTVRGDEDLMIVTDKGMIIRTHLDQILTIGRDTQGVRLIMLNEGHSVANIAIVPRGDDSEDEFDEDGNIKGLKVGQTTIHVLSNYDGYEGDWQEEQYIVWKKK